jgi:hypothetical protein
MRLLAADVLEFQANVERRLVQPLLARPLIKDLAGLPARLAEEPADRLRRRVLWLDPPEALLFLLL